MAVFEYIGGGGGGGGVQTVVAGTGISVDSTDAENPIVSSSVAGFTAGAKLYAALLAQSGTDAPVATVLQNDLGGTVVWGYTSTGVYTGTLTGAFVVNKTWVAKGGFNGGTGSGYNVNRSSANVISVVSYDGGVESDDIL